LFVSIFWSNEKERKKNVINEFNCAKPVQSQHRQRERENAKSTHHQETGTQEEYTTTSRSNRTTKKRNNNNNNKEKE